MTNSSSCDAAKIAVLIQKLKLKKNKELKKRLRDLQIMDFVGTVCYEVNVMGFSWLK
jgi:DNA polymerase/3'-5' exonuclease PolX